MFRAEILLFFLAMTFSCEDTGRAILSNSSGKINDISVVISDELWQGNVGEAIKKSFARPVYGLPQIEPVFSLRQIPTKVFSDFATKSRTILKVDLSEKAGIYNLKNVYATPQRVVQIKGRNSQEIIQIINNNLNEIYSSLYFSEIREKQRRISKSLNKTQIIKNTIGIKLNFPTSYRIAKSDTNFVWIRRDIKSGSVNLFISKFIDKSNRPIIKIRDSIASRNIPGPTENTYMSTDLIYKPNTEKVYIGSKKFFETRGLWEIKDEFMAGPFLNYYHELDSIKSKFLMIDGFVFSPGSKKRDYIFELEAIIRSIEY